jgi:hypothetical protein
MLVCTRADYDSFVFHHSVCLLVSELLVALLNGILLKCWIGAQRHGVARFRYVRQGCILVMLQYLFNELVVSSGLVCVGVTFPKLPCLLARRPWPRVADALLDLVDFDFLFLLVCCNTLHREQIVAAHWCAHPRMLYYPSSESSEPCLHIYAAVGAYFRIMEISRRANQVRVMVNVRLAAGSH